MVLQLALGAMLGATLASDVDVRVPVEDDQVVDAQTPERSEGDAASPAVDEHPALPALQVLTPSTSVKPQAVSPAPAANPTHDRRPGRAKHLGIGFGLLAGSAGLWAGTVRLRRLPAILAARRQCQEQTFGEQLGCGIAAGISSGFDTATYWGLSYATAIPAAALMGASGYMFGKARRRPLANPRGLIALGAVAAVAGGVTWAIPRVAFIGSEGDAAFETLTPSFYAAVGLIGVGSGLIAYAIGGKEHRDDPRHARVRVGLGPTGLVASGRF